MEKITAYKRAGKFGDEYLIPLKCLELLRKKETEKAYCCGEYTGYTYKDGNPQVHIFRICSKINAGKSWRRILCSNLDN